ncbi:hypothetical protein BGZ96_000746, partial [Linnemannia gamsii]
MCGFGEKDRRPVDPPPIVQLLLDEQHDQHPARRAHRSAIAAALAAASSTGGKKGGSSNKKKSAGTGKKTKGGKKAGARAGQEEDADEESTQGDHDDDEGDEAFQQEESDADETGTGDRKTTSTRNGRSLKGGAVVKDLKRENGAGSTSSPSLGKHGRQSAKSDHSNSDSDNSNNSDSENDDNTEDDHGGDMDEQDPLFVLHVSLWSHDGTEVRNMIATPGQSDPPKLTRILMGSLVVSPILLNNPEGVPGWYFSFPDLSIRTEGTYTLKFSLMRFG